MPIVSDPIEENAFLHTHRWRDKITILIFVATDEHVGGLEDKPNVTDKVWPNGLPFPRFPAVDIVIMSVARYHYLKSRLK